MAIKTELLKQLQSQLREALAVLRRDADAAYREALALLQSCADEVSAFLRGANDSVSVSLELGHVVDMGQEYRLVVKALDIGLSDHLFRAYVPAGGFPVNLDYLAEESIPCSSPEELVRQLVVFIENANVRARLAAIAQVLNDETVRGERTEVKRLDGALVADAATVARSKRGPSKQAVVPRSPFDELTARLLHHIRTNPGQRIETIAMELEENTRKLSRAAKQLRREGKVNTKGQKRSTAYFATRGKQTPR